MDLYSFQDMADMNIFYDRANGNNMEAMRHARELVRDVNFQISI
jgi:hypothetical protein